MKLQREYPGCELFSAENFQHCPWPVVKKALDEAAEDRFVMLDYQNRPLSYAAAFFSGLYTKKGQNLKPEDFNVFERVNKDKESKRLIPQPAAQLILDELAEQRVPDWVVALMDVGALRAAAVR